MVILKLRNNVKTEDTLIPLLVIEIGKIRYCRNYDGKPSRRKGKDVEGTELLDINQ
jgi:hypothetical protein